MGEERGQKGDKRGRGEGRKRKRERRKRRDLAFLPVMTSVVR